MIPEERLSTELVFANLVLPNPEPSDLESLQYGGIGLGDASQGIFYQVWKLFVVPGDEIDDVMVEAPNTPATVITQDVSITSASLAFDQNARPTVAYYSAGVAKLFWYDSFIEDFRTSSLEDLMGNSGASAPVCTMDDHRNSMVTSNDIIVVYIRDGNLYYLQQRDRYATEHLLYPDINTAIISPQVVYVGMNKELRLQIKIRGNFYGG